MRSPTPLVACAMMVAAALGTASASGFSTTLSGFCDNSIRVQMTPKSASPAVAASRGNLAARLEAEGLAELPGAFVTTTCTPDSPTTEGHKTMGDLTVTATEDGALTAMTVDSGKVLFTARAEMAPSDVYPGFLTASLVITAGDKTERIYGLGQGNWTALGGCAVGSPQVVVPLERNGQTVELLQRKFHVTIPFVFSTAGYGFVLNMPGYGHVAVGEQGVGGMRWDLDAALGFDFWITTGSHHQVYRAYADATGHSPMLPEDAMVFWQSRNRYKSSDIAIAVAEKYRKLELDVGVLVIDYKNQIVDGDFAPNPSCYPSVKNLSTTIQSLVNATTVFSFWPEVKVNAAEYGPLRKAGCLINTDLSGFAIDSTPEHCRTMIWNEYIKPRYYDQGVHAYWLDETDGEGTAGGDVPEPTGKPQGGYNTSFGIPAAYSNLWVNQWISIFTDPVAQLGEHAPLALTRGVWAGGQRHGIVLWSSDIESTYEELTAQLNLGVHASLSGIPWWTSDVGGYGCGNSRLNNSPYMQQLMVRWYQFGAFSPVFRTHGCRKDPDPDPNVAPCLPKQRSCGPNEIWSYGDATQAILEKYVKLRSSMKPYIAELAKNVTDHGVPTVRPLWWEFPEDPQVVGVNDQYMFGPDYLVAPVTTQNTTSRAVYFPAGASWTNIFDKSDVVNGGIRKTVPAPLERIPVYLRS